jgi:hypothetical protein
MGAVLKLIEELELELLAPETRANRTRLDDLIADDFIEVGASGLTFGKDVVLAHLPDEQGVAFQASRINSRLLSPTVGLVTYDCVKTQGDSRVHSKRSSIWINKGGTWQMTYHQGTGCEPSGAT